MKKCLARNVPISCSFFFTDLLKEIPRFITSQIDDVDARQYIEIEEAMEIIGDDDDYESLEIFIGKIFDNAMMHRSLQPLRTRKRLGDRKDGLSRSRTSKDIIMRVYTCNKEGFRRADKRQEGRDTYQCRETRCGCKKRMEIAQRHPGLAISF